MDVTDFYNISNIQDQVKQTAKQIYEDQLEAKRRIVGANAKFKQLENLRDIRKQSYYELIKYQITLSNVQQYRELCEVANAFYVLPERFDDDAELTTLMAPRKGNVLVEQFFADLDLFTLFMKNKLVDVPSVKKSAPDLMKKSPIAHAVKRYFIEKGQRPGIGESFLDVAGFIDLYVKSYVIIHWGLDYDPFVSTNKKKYPPIVYYMHSCMRWMTEHVTRIREVGTPKRENKMLFTEKDLPIDDVNSIETDHDNIKSVIINQINDPLLQEYRDIDTLIGYISNINPSLDLVKKSIVTEYPSKETYDKMKKKIREQIVEVGLQQRLEVPDYEQFIKEARENIRKRTADETALDQSAADELVDEDLTDILKQESDKNKPDRSKEEEEENERFRENLEIIKLVYRNYESIEQDPVQLPPLFTVDDIKSSIGNEYPYSFIRSVKLKDHLHLIVKDSKSVFAQHYRVPETKINSEFLENRINKLRMGLDTGDITEDPINTIDTIYSIANERAAASTSSIKPYLLGDEKYKETTKSWSVKENEMTVMCLLLAESYSLAIYLYEHASSLRDSYDSAIRKLQVIISDISAEQPRPPSKETIIQKYLTSGRDSLAWRLQPEISGKILWNTLLTGIIDDTLLRIRAINPGLAKLASSLYIMNHVSGPNGYANRMNIELTKQIFEDSFNDVREYSLMRVSVGKEVMMLIINDERPHLNVNMNEGVGEFAPW